MKWSNSNLHYNIILSARVSFYSKNYSTYEQVHGHLSWMIAYTHTWTSYIAFQLSCKYLTRFYAIVEMVSSIFTSGCDYSGWSCVRACLLAPDTLCPCLKPVQTCVNLARLSGVYKRINRSGLINSWGCANTTIAHKLSSW